MRRVGMIAAAVVLVSAGFAFAEMTGAELASKEKGDITRNQRGLVKPGLRLTEKEIQPWQDLKFGMFIHWGLYSIPARGEWAMHNEKIPAAEYAKLADQFNPQRFDANAWAQVAKDAGMKYMVLTARHHDGFSLWDSPSSYGDYTSYKTVAKRDFVKEYVKACRKAGMMVGIYYSPMDWRFPGYFDPKGLPDNALLMKKQCWGQVKELCTRFGKIDILWYDGGWLAHQGTDADGAWLWESVKLNEMVRGYNRNTVISPRSGWEGDYETNEGDGRVGGPIIPRPWEKCLNLNRSSWGYNTKQNLMSFEDVITMVLDVVVRNGNVLLNVGPDPDGVIPAAHVERLRQVGAWMKEYGDSIYATRGGPFEPTEFYGSTYRGKTIYIHARQWPADGKIKLPAISQKIKASSLLRGGKVSVEQANDGITISVAPIDRGLLDTVVVLELDKPVTGLIAK
jgi:alpha-L-fucosidase